MSRRSLMPYYGVMFLSEWVFNFTVHFIFAFNDCRCKPDLLLVVLFNSFFRGPYHGLVLVFYWFLEDLYLGSFGNECLAKASTAFSWLAFKRLSY